MRTNKGIKSQGSANQVAANEPELNLRQDPGNPLEAYRKEVQLDEDFFKKLFIHVDPFDTTKSEQDLRTY